MSKGRKLTTTALVASAMLVQLGTRSEAAQCGHGPGRFEAWKQEFAREAQAKGIGATGVAALRQTNYASATIAADRSQRSFGLSLDQFLAKRGASTIVARGRSLKASQAALFASQPVSRLGLAGPGRVPRQAPLGLRDQRLDLGQGALAVGWR